MVCICQGSIAKKPYNPIIGETFHCSWVLPPSDDAPGSLTTDTAGDEGEGRRDQPGEGENGDRGSGETLVEERRLLYYCAEQVSHHPPSKSLRASVHSIYMP